MGQWRFWRESDDPEAACWDVLFECDRTRGPVRLVSGKKNAVGTYDASRGELNLVCGDFELSAGASISGKSLKWSFGDRICVVDRSDSDLGNVEEGRVSNLLVALAGDYVCEVVQGVEGKSSQVVKIRTQRISLVRMRTEDSSKNRHRSTLGSGKENERESSSRKKAYRKSSTPTKKTSRKSCALVKRGCINGVFRNHVIGQWISLDEASKELSLWMSTFPASLSLETIYALRGQSGITNSSLQHLVERNLIRICGENARCDMHDSVRFLLRQKALPDAALHQQQFARYLATQMRNVDKCANSDTMAAYICAEQFWINEMHNILYSFEVSADIGNFDLYSQLMVAGAYSMRYMLSPDKRIRLLERLVSAQSQDCIPTVDTDQSSDLCCSIGRAYLDCQRFSDAQPYLEEVCKYLRAKLAEDAQSRYHKSRIAQALQALAEIYIELNQSEAAVQLMMESLSHRRQLDGTDSIPFAVGLSRLAAALFRQHQIEEAETVLVWQNKLMEQRDMIFSSEGAYMYSTFASLYLVKGEFEKGRTACEDALNCFNLRKISGNNLSFLEKNVYVTMGRISESAGDIDVALKSYRASLAIAKSHTKELSVLNKTASSAISRCKQTLYRKTQKTRLDDKAEGQLQQLTNTGS
mmetsp:Transcript_514/g.1760  ORF Transcript_514/g.1760 Transcript_514/m.1760 type:complete len:641 (+) Transcript_514:85-2007(+)